MRAYAFLGLLTLAGFSPASWSFPDMIRHKYSNCTVCHVAPTGGGLLTAYGRALSVEALSTWGGENEGNLLHGLLPPEKLPAWLNLGGDVRAVQINSESAASRDKRFIFMQGDLEAALNFGKWTIDGTFGPIYQRDHVYGWGSHHFYAMYQATEAVHVRVGRFYPAFGLNIPEHEAYTRGPLGFYIDAESYNVEVGYLNESVSAFLTASQARPEYVAGKKEEALSAQFDYTFFERYRLGWGRWQGVFTDSSRVMTSLHGMLGFTDRGYLLFDTVYQEIRNPTSGDQRGFFVFARPGYEVIKGLHVFGVLETLQANFTDATTIQRKFGVGTQFYPRPHFDFQFEYYKNQVATKGQYWADVYYLMLHYWI